MISRKGPKKGHFWLDPRVQHPPITRLGTIIYNNCHFWKHEAMGKVVEGWNVIIFCHFCKNQAIISSAKSSEIVVHWLAGLGWAGYEYMILYCLNNYSRHMSKRVFPRSVKKAHLNVKRLYSVVKTILLRYFCVTFWQPD